MSRKQLSLRTGPAGNLKPKDRWQRLGFAAATAATLVALYATPVLAAEHTVAPGENLWQISRRYGTTVEALRAANNLKGNIVRPGEKLIVPDDTVAPVAKPVPPSSSDKPAESDVRHTVQEGDTLYGIGQKYQVSVEALRAANKLTSDIIQPGQVLVIPEGDRKMRASAEISRGGERSDQVSTLLSLARELLGRPYRYGAAGPGAFDCSGFTAYVFAQLGRSLPHNSAAQADVGRPVERGELEAGDLVFFGYYDSRDIRHVGIYVGGNRFIHASTAGGVKYSSLADPYYANNYKGARRLL